MDSIVCRGKCVLGVLFLCLLVLFHLEVLKKINHIMSEGKENKETLSGALFSASKGEEKKAYLTFDDGPSDNTDRILDILKEKGVKATFFVVGKEGKAAKERYRRIVEEGHSLGMHSFSHQYEEIYASMENYREDLEKLNQYLYEVTGIKSDIYRFPGGSSNRVSKVPITECITYLKEKGIEYYDWNASSEDAVLPDKKCSVLNENILKDALNYKNTMILMHDLSGCTETVEGLSSLIDRLLLEGYEIKAIDETTVPIHHR